MIKQREKNTVITFVCLSLYEIRFMYRANPLYSFRKVGKSIRNTFIGTLYINTLILMIPRGFR